MRSALYFTIGLFLSFCLFWPSFSHAGYGPLTWVNDSGYYMAYNSGIWTAWSGGRYIRYGNAGTTYTQLCTSTNTASCNVTAKYVVIGQTCGGPPTWGSGTISTAWDSCSGASDALSVCSDGFKNTNEEGTDCGGECGPCTIPCESYTYGEWSECVDGTHTREYLTRTPPNCGDHIVPPILSESCTIDPAHCSDGVKDYGEAGIDCGSPCSAACTYRCPDGWTAIATGCIDQSLGSQFQGAATCPDGYSPPANCPGQTLKCPSGYAIAVPSEPNTCYYIQAKQYSSDSAPFNYTPVNYSGLSTAISSNTAATSNTSTTSTTDTATNTTTTTTTSTTTNNLSGGGTTTTTTNNTTIINNTTGEVTESAETDYTFTPPSRIQNPYDATVGEQSRFSVRFDGFVNELKTSSIYGPLNSILNPDFDPGVSSFTYSLGSYGTSTVDLADYDSLWDMIATALMFAAMWVAARIVIANK